MDWILNQSLVDLGIETVVIGVAKQVNPQAPLSADFLAKKKEMEDWALNCDLSSVKEEPVVQGYLDLLKDVGRSVKKNPPTILALIKNIQSRGFLPTINSVIDIYNVECLSSFLAIGGHDLDKIQGPIEFTISQREDSFLPILSTEKHVSESDPVYRDQQGIMAWLDVRDGERYKMEETTRNVLFIIQGNRATSVEMRLEALDRIREDLASCMPNVRFEKLLVTTSGTTQVL